MITVRYFFSDVCVNCQESRAGWEEFKSRNARKAEFVEHLVSRGTIAEQYNIEGTPTWIIFQDGQEIFRTLGADFKNLQNTFDEALTGIEPDISDSVPDKPNVPDPPSQNNKVLLGLGILFFGIIILKE